MKKLENISILEHAQILKKEFESTIENAPESSKKHFEAFLYKQAFYFILRDLECGAVVVDD